VVEIVAVGLDHPGGGLFDKQFDLLQLPPGHDEVQKEETELHQVENWKQLRLSGNPACRKQDASWTEHEEKADQQEFWSVQDGRGLEHQFPHLYSHVGLGETVTVEVQREAVVLVVARKC